MAPTTSPSEGTSRSSSSSSSFSESSSTSSSGSSSATSASCSSSVIGADAPRPIPECDRSRPIPECATRKNFQAPTELRLANSSHHCWGCNKKIHSTLLRGSLMSDLIVNNPSAVGISLHNGNIIAVGDNKTRGICFTCLAPLFIFFSGPIHHARTKVVASGFEVQEPVASVVKVQEAVTSVVEVQDVNDNGLNFLPECNNACFVGKKNIGCTHLRRYVRINKLGDYVLFTSHFWHHGYFNDESDKHFITAQLLTKRTISEDTERFSCSFNVGQQEIITGQLGTTLGEYTIIKDLSDDLLENWDTTYPAIDYPPPKMFGEMPIDRELNRKIPFEKLNERPRIKALVKEIFPYMSIDRIALLHKRRKDDDFQKWHQDYKLGAGQLQRHL